MNIQLIFLDSCPNAGPARELLRGALLDCGLPPKFEEVDTSNPATPDHLAQWGSPTILIDGRDVGGEVATTGPACRLYRDHEGRLTGTPSAEAIKAALLGVRT